jgi:uncharacterized protein YjiS (DUF1127 family)
MKRRTAMTASECTETHASRPLALNLVSIVTAKVASLFRAVRNRREMYHLGQMSDVELADIGLRRGDLFAVSENPLGADPTGQLNALVRGRASEDFARLND